MKTKKLLERLVELLDSDIRRKKKERKALKEVLKKLKNKEQKLVSELANESDEGRRSLLKKQSEVNGG